MSTVDDAWVVKARRMTQADKERLTFPLLAAALAGDHAGLADLLADITDVDQLHILTSLTLGMLDEVAGPHQLRAVAAQHLTETVNGLESHEPPGLLVAARARLAALALEG